MQKSKNGIYGYNEALEILKRDKAEVIKQKNILEDLIKSLTEEIEKLEKRGR